MRPEEGIARILDADGRPVGLAFAVAGGQVVTCAHVVNAALGRRPRDDRSPGLVAITLAFLFGRAVGADARSQATLVHWQPTHGAFDLNDLALLRLTGDLPVGVTPLAIGGADPAGPVQMLGPVADRRTHGHVTGTLLGAVQPGRFQVNQAVAGAFRVGHGFSGGPVWRPSTGEVVAVLQASAVDDGATDVYALDIALVADALATPADSRPSWSARQRRAFEAVWRAFAQVDDFNRHGIARAIHSGSVEPSTWTVLFDAQATVNTERLNLPEPVYDLANRALHELEVDINGLIAELRRILASGNTGVDLNAHEYLSSVNQHLTHVTSAFQTAMDAMRHA